MVNGLTESELLEAFIGEGSEAAFNELIQQHVDLVYSAAVRITGNEELAEDAVQFVFIAFAKDARSVLRKLKAGAPLSGWLHTTTATWRSHQNRWLAAIELHQWPRVGAVSRAICRDDAYLLTATPFLSCRLSGWQ